MLVHTFESNTGGGFKRSTSESDSGFAEHKPRQNPNSQSLLVSFPTRGNGNSAVATTVATSADEVRPCWVTKYKMEENVEAGKIGGEWRYFPKNIGREAIK